MANACRIGIVWAISLQVLIAPVAAAFDATYEPSIDEIVVTDGEATHEDTPDAEDATAEFIEDLALVALPSSAEMHSGDVGMATLGASENHKSAMADVSVGVVDNPIDNQSSSEEIAENVQSNFYGIVITQLQTTGGTGRAAEDMVEVRNNSLHAIDVTGWQLKYASGGSESWSTVAIFSPPEDAVGWRLILPPGTTYLLGTQQFVAAHAGLTVDKEFSAAIANAQGRLAIYNQIGELQGGLAWGSTAIPVEGTPATMPSSGGVIERLMRDEVWHQNTRDNKTDFISGQLRSSYTIGQVEEVFDSCLNLDGIQLVVPDGQYRDAATGDCSDHEPTLPNVCDGLQITEIAANVNEQFIELHNPTNGALDLGGCRLMTNRSESKYFQFDSEQLAAGGYRVVRISNEVDLILTKTTSGTVYLLSEDGQHEVDSVSYANLSADTSWALADGAWHQTYKLTPGTLNMIERFLPCDEGYLRNVETGRCNRIVAATEPMPCAVNQFRSEETGRCRMLTTSTSTLTPCREDQYRHPETNRCRSLVSTASSLTPCREGQVRNPATNRCRNIASTVDTLKPCQEGWERNPDTNRCRKIQTLATISDFPVEPIVDTGKGFAAWWALGGLTLLGAGYGAWEWRRELAGLITRNKST